MKKFIKDFYKVFGVSVDLKLTIFRIPNVNMFHAFSHEHFLTQDHEIFAESGLLDYFFLCRRKILFLLNFFFSLFHLIFIIFIIISYNQHPNPDP